MQLNGVDCGVFLCKYCDYLSDNVPLHFTQGDLGTFRRRMLYEIVTASIASSAASSPAANVTALSSATGKRSASSNVEPDSVSYPSTSVKRILLIALPTTR